MYASANDGLGLLLAKAGCRDCARRRTHFLVAQQESKQRNAPLLPTTLRWRSGQPDFGRLAGVRQNSLRSFVAPFRHAAVSQCLMFSASLDAENHRPNAQSQACSQGGIRERERDPILDANGQACESQCVQLPCVLLSKAIAIPWEVLAPGERDQGNSLDFSKVF